MRKSLFTSESDGNDGEDKLPRAALIVIVVAGLVGACILGYFIGKRSGRNEALLQFEASQTLAKNQAVQQGLQGKAPSGAAAGSGTTAETTPGTTGNAAAPQTTTPATQAAMIPVGIEWGNTLSMICLDLYGNGTAAIYEAVASVASGNGFPNPNNPDLIIAGGTILVPASISIGGRIYVADLARARARAKRRNKLDGMNVPDVTGNGGSGGQAVNDPKSPNRNPKIRMSSNNADEAVTMPVSTSKLAACSSKAVLPQALKAAAIANKNTRTLIASRLGAMGAHAPPAPNGKKGV